MNALIQTDSQNIQKSNKCNNVPNSYESINNSFLEDQTIEVPYPKFMQKETNLENPLMSLDIPKSVIIGGFACLALYLISQRGK